ncbi:MAG: MoxR family ATPase, partial [Candidatus Woesearchaeota archaeon]|nr:MoxR family ATPase [Candidatus Woesearchaeota archaeon]
MPVNMTLIERCRADLNKVKNEVAKVVVGQRPLIDGLLRALLANGHVLIEGVPGIAKTLIVRALAASTSCKFKRIQFTADLLPTDILGITSYEE